MKKMMLLLVVVSLVAAAQAATIPLVNGGFEQPATGKITAGFDSRRNGCPGLEQRCDDRLGY